MSSELLSFIIPALNEEQNIANILCSIQSVMSGTPHEIILVDNGSTDDTCSIATSMGARVLVEPKASIARLRNLGVAASSGDILIFLDADMQLKDNWFSVLSAQIRTFPENHLIVTGSTCSIPPNPSFIERHWFSKHGSSPTNYINSGHLVTTRTLFNLISGFDDRLKTSEDYDFCQRALKSGAILKQNMDLVAYHYGYPKTIRQFMLREAWHGREDIKSLKKYLHSKSAIAATVNSLILLTGLIASALTLNVSGIVIALGLSMGICLLLTWKKFGSDTPSQTLTTALCFECYLLGRTLSLFNGTHRPSARA